MEVHVMHGVGSKLFWLGVTSFMAIAAPVASADAQMRGEFQYRTQTYEVEARILGALVYTDITAEFNNTELRNVMQFLKDSTGVNMAIRWLSDSIAEGLDPELPITMSIDHQPALDVLERILDASAMEGEELSWQLHHGILEVGPKNWLGRRSAQVIRTYDIENLIFEIPNFDNAPTLDLGNFGGGGGGLGGGGVGGGLGGGGGTGGGGGGNPGSLSPTDEEERIETLIQLIVDFVEPTAWNRNGGSWASIREYRGSLIIRAPKFVQRQLEGYPFEPIPPAGSTSNRSLSYEQDGISVIVPLSERLKRERALEDSKKP